MKTTDQYKTIQTASHGEYKEKGSKFISIAFPVRTEDEVKNRLTDLKKEFHDARHYCYAYIIGVDKSTIRSSDDGEPSNSAGKPILTQIEIRDLTNLLVVVVRYFGGTKLGVGGLINAYKTASSSALDKAKIITQVPKERYILTFDYPQMNNVMSLVKESGFDIISKNFDARCILTIDIPSPQAGEFLTRCKRIDNLEFSKV